ncbi:chorismate synthase [Candidatus Gracilibacteria bacterium]|nr:chorismate synthase [Candidatus Gracilibacteria bacterium]MCF7819049.1 chorismate synthase [Candidatus Gracilibacteria bacterium]
MNTFGTVFRLTCWGESHGRALGALIDGCPPGLELSESDIQKELDRRRPGQHIGSSPRQENDRCEILSGVFEGKTTGMPISVLVRNTDVQSKDYESLKNIYRPSHADLTYQLKYGIRDYRGGGRSSGRETVARVIGGAIAKKILAQQKIQIIGFSREIGGQFFEHVDFSYIKKNPLRMADKKNYKKALQILKQAKEGKDSLGGVAEIHVQNPSAGLGSPVFGKLESDLARACLSVGSVKGFEIGEGFALSRMNGSEANDSFLNSSSKSVLKDFKDQSFLTQRNANGGILGGISTGEDIWFRVAVKPPSSIGQSQETIDSSGKKVKIKIEGRYDTIILPRVIPVLESMTALVLVDHLLLHRAQCGN